MTVRQSGTEPKIKAHLEVVVPVTGTAVGSARARAAERLASLAVNVRARLTSAG